MENFRVYFKAKFNREIDKEKDYISPGGFSVIIDGKEIDFDFQDSYSYIDKNDKRYCEFEMINPDLDSFNNISLITKDSVKNISKITECYVYTGESDETDLFVESIESFEFDFDDIENEISNSILKEFNNNLNLKSINSAKKCDTINVALQSVATINKNKRKYDSETIMAAINKKGDDQNK